MIREDYILAWIKRYVRWLAEIAGFIQVADHEAALRRIDQALRGLLDLGPDSVMSLSDGEILARLTLGEPSQLVQDKCVVLAALLNQLAIVCAAREQPEQSRDCLVKALHLVLGLKLRAEAVHVAGYAPTIENLEERLKSFDLPPRTYAALMIYHERAGQFDKAEDALFSLLEAAPGQAEAIELGAALYHRLQSLSDEVLTAGNLPRAEVEAGLAELGRRAAAKP
jgi:tetratricopeptide (TPR) repeat protein